MGQQVQQTKGFLRMGRIHSRKIKSSKTVLSLLASKSALLGLSIPADMFPHSLLVSFLSTNNDYPREDKLYPRWGASVASA